MAENVKFIEFEKVPNAPKLAVPADFSQEQINEYLKTEAVENAMFEKFGIYDPELTKKARDTRAMYEMNKKIWRLRKRYAKLIADEIFEGNAEPEPVEAPEA